VPAMRGRFAMTIPANAKVFADYPVYPATSRNAPSANLVYEAPTSCKALPLVSTPMVRTIMQAIQKKAAMVMNIP
jgi:hypothetical protein